MQRKRFIIVFHERNEVILINIWLIIISEIKNLITFVTMNK